MKTYEEMAQSALARGKAIRKERKARNARLLKGFAGLAACCLVVVLFARMARMGVQLSPPAKDPSPMPSAPTAPIHLGDPTIPGTNEPTIQPTDPAGDPNAPTEPATPPTGPSPMQPTNLRFDSIAQLRELLALADEGEEAVENWLREHGRHHVASFYTPEKIREFETLLNDIRLPCRNDSDRSFHCMYYSKTDNVQLFNNVEIFYDVDGIRYFFASSTSAARAPDGAKTTPITLDGVTGELWEDDFGSERRLFAIFQVDGRTVSMWADTTDPNRVDLSGFFWGNILKDTE